MKRISVAAITLLCLFLSAQAFGQTDASLSGTISDAQEGVIEGAVVKVTNDSTNVVTTTVTNAAGVYNFPRLLPGTYTVQAEKESFSTKTIEKLPLGSSQQARLNIQLDVGREDKVIVNFEKDRVIIDSDPSAKDVLNEKMVQELPSTGRNALDFVRLMSGVVLADDPIFNANGSSFAGVNASGVNIQRDGITVNDVRWPAGINAATRVNPDLVGEFRMVLAPVDAEIGRGNAQIQISTRSGTDEFHGGLAWNVQNTALDPNTWENNRNHADPPWRNLHQYTASVGGPIIKHKTFFFALFDGQVNKIRTPNNATILTPCARQGIFRFYDYWNNGNSTSTLNVGATPVARVVDAQGNLTPPPAMKPEMVNSDGTLKDGAVAHNGILRYASIYGQLRQGFVPDSTCSNYNAANDLVADSAWDPVRDHDTSGYIDYFLGRMPQVNNYDVGDGLNTAGHRWARTIKGADNLFGIGEDTYRRQINVRIDHNFSDVHRVHGSWSWEKSWAEDNFPNWPNGYTGVSIRRPQVLTVNLISSLKPTLLNEARFGMSRTGSNIYSPYNNPDRGQELRDTLPVVNGIPMLVGVGAGDVSFVLDGQGSYLGTRGVNPYSGYDSSPRWTMGDTMSWTRGTHSFRFGGEFRRASSEAHNQWTGPFSGGYTAYPYAAGGETVGIQGFTAANMGFVDGEGVAQLTGNRAFAAYGMGGNISRMADLLNFQAGSLGEIRQWRFINNSDATEWNDPINDQYLVRNVVQKEFSMFFKDDWKITPDLTLNLGVRYDYYGVPYLDNGLTTTLFGGTGRLFGRTGSSFADWLKPITKDMPDPGVIADSALMFVGEGTSNPDGRLYNRDWNNVGPAVGFSYQIPWFGKGKTTIRGGYQINYIGNTGRASTIQSAAGEAPGTTYRNKYTNNSAYLDIQIAQNNNVLPLAMPEGITPALATFPVTDRLQDITVVAPDYVTPYVQNITFAVTRNVTSSLMVDLRYVGTLSRKTFSNFNINFPNFITNGLLDAFNDARAGGNPALLNEMLLGETWFDMSTFTLRTVDGVSFTGADWLRSQSGFNSNIGFFEPGWFQAINSMLATGNYQGLVNSLNSWGTPRGGFLARNGFPEFFLKPNPQFNNATYETNGGHTNYHSFQAQVTLRPTHGVDFQSTYSWAKSLGIGGGLPYDPRDKWADYTLTGNDRRHNWVTYGNFALPVGPGKLLGKNTSGVLARFIEGWQTSWITTVQSGAVLSIGANNGMYGTGVPNLVGSFDADSIGVYWPNGADNGNYFGYRYEDVNDPQCASVWAGGQGTCNTSLRAIADAQTGELVFTNPLPGTRGNFGYNKITGPMRWNVDMAVSKLVQIDETKSLRIRVDMANIFNHPQPSGTLGSTGTRIVFPTAPDVNINGGTFGNMPFKVGGRTFQLMARFDF